MLFPPWELQPAPVPSAGLPSALSSAPPDCSALEFRQRHAAKVDLVKDGVKLHFPFLWKIRAAISI
jgi:hypothetical protein